MTNMLELHGVSRSFNSLRAVDDVSLAVRSGSRHAVIGPNGAGKSTLFNLIAGGLAVSSGRIVFDGRDVTRLPQYRRARLGIARTFQHSSLFIGQTVLENVLVAVQARAGLGARPWWPALRHRELIEQCDELLERVGLQDASATPVGELSHGERRRLELALALAGSPRLLLFDEPAAGMSVAETERFSSLIAALPAGITVLLIEHDLDVVFGMADTVTVLHLGGRLATGTPAQIRSSAEVHEAYLGGADESELFLT